MIQPRQYQPRGDEPTKSASVSLTPDDWRWLDRKAALAGKSRSYVIAQLIDRARFAEPHFDEEVA